MALKLKLDSEGHAVLQDGKPVYVDEADGKELAFDAAQMYHKINELGAENKKHRETARQLEQRLEAFGDANPEDIESFLDTLEELGGPDGIAELKAKGKVDVEAIKRSITEAYEGKLSEKDKLIGDKDSRIFKLMVSSQFGTSKFASEKLILPPDIAEATFGKHFRIEDDQVVAYLGDNKIFSRERPGEAASFDEALQVIVDSYPMKDRILKAPGGGSGATGGAGHSGGGKTRSRSEFDALGPVERSKFISDGGIVTD